jgi:hypothetical protein
MECLYRLFMFMFIINGAKSFTNLYVALEDVPVLRIVCSNAQICLLSYTLTRVSFGVTSTDSTPHRTEIARLDRWSLP